MIDELRHFFFFFFLLLPFLLTYKLACWLVGAGVKFFFLFLTNISGKSLDTFFDFEFFKIVFLDVFFTLVNLGPPWFGQIFRQLFCNLCVKQRVGKRVDHSLGALFPSRRNPFVLTKAQDFVLKKKSSLNRSSLARVKRIFGQYILYTHFSLFSLWTLPQCLCLSKCVCIVVHFEGVSWS